MGNQVIFAIHHNDLDALTEKNPGFSEFTDEQMMSAWVPRLFHSASVASKYHHYNRSDGMVTSSYFDSNDGASFYVNTQGIFYSSLFSLMSTENFNKGPAGLINEMKRAKNYTFDLHDYAIESCQKTVINDAKDANISVFGFLTDNFNTLSDKKDIVKLIIGAIKNNDWSTLPHHVKHIVNLNERQGAIVRMRGGCFDHILYPNISVETNSTNPLLSTIEQDMVRYDEEQLVNQLSINLSILNGLGYNLTKNIEN